MIFAETSELPTSPLDWLMGPGCACCLPQTHPRHRLLQAVVQPGTLRIIIDAGPPGVADRIASMLCALPVPLSVKLLAT